MSENRQEDTTPSSRARHIDARNSLETIMSMMQSLSLEYEIRQKINEKNIKELMAQNNYLHLEIKKMMKQNKITPSELLKIELPPNQQMPDSVGIGTPHVSPDIAAIKKSEPEIPEFVKAYKCLVKNINALTEKYINNINKKDTTPSSLLFAIREHLKIDVKINSFNQNYNNQTKSNRGYNDSVRGTSANSRNPQSDVQLENYQKPGKSNKLVIKTDNIDRSNDVNVLTSDSINASDSNPEFIQFTKTMNASDKMKKIIEKSDPDSEQISVPSKKSNSARYYNQDYRNRSDTITGENNSFTMNATEMNENKLLDSISADTKTTSNNPFILQKCTGSCSHDIKNFLPLNDGNAYQGIDLEEIFFGNFPNFTTAYEVENNQKNLDGKIIKIAGLQNIFPIKTSTDVALAVTKSKVFAISAPIFNVKPIVSTDEQNCVQLICDSNSPIIDATGHMFDECPDDDDDDDDDDNNEAETAANMDFILLLEKNSMCTFLKFKFCVSVEVVLSFNTTYSQENPFRVLICQYGLDCDDNQYPAILIYPHFVRYINCAKIPENNPLTEKIIFHSNETDICITCACINYDRLGFGFNNGHAFIFDLISYKILHDVNFNKPLRDIYFDPELDSFLVDQSIGISGYHVNSRTGPFELQDFAMADPMFVPIRYDPKMNAYIFFDKIMKFFYCCRLEENKGITKNK